MSKPTNRGVAGKGAPARRGGLDSEKEQEQETERAH